MATLLQRGLGRIRRTLFPTRSERGYAHWRADGNRGHRFDYPLGPEALVVDAGGFDGRWAEQALDHFGATVHVFEAVPEFADATAARLAGTRACVHRFGLAGTTRETEFKVAGDGSSHLRSEGRPVRARLRAAAEVFEELGLGRVDFLKVNIEGGEYELLEHLLDRGWMRRIGFLQVQFHELVPGAFERMQAIRERLRATHAPEWSYEFVWESWRPLDCAPFPGIRKPE